MKLPSFSALAFPALALLGWTSLALAQECADLRALWKWGNYGLVTSAGWPARANGQPMSLVEVDAELGESRRRLMTLYSQFYSGDFIVGFRGGTRLKDALEQLGALQALYSSRPTPELAQQILGLRQALGQAKSQLDAQAAPLRTRYEQLQALCRQARKEFRAMLESRCGSAAAPGFDLRNWESLPDPPPLGLPPEPPDFANFPPTPVPPRPGALPEESSLWSETPGAQPYPTLPPQPSPTRPAPQPTPVAAAPDAGEREGFEHESFLAMIAQPDEGDALPLTPVVPRPGLDPEARADDFELHASASPEPATESLVPVLGAEPQFEEATLIEAGVRPTPRARQEPAEAEAGKTYLLETFYKGLGPERLGGIWSVEEGVLRAQGTGDESLYVLGRDPQWLNYEVETDFRIDGGAFESGLLLRARGAQLEDGYVLRMRTRQAPGLSFHDPIDLAIRRKGKLQNIVCGGGGNLDAQRWYKLGLRLDFSQIEIRIDGRLVLTCKDDAFGSGGAALRVAGATQARFDNITVREIPVGFSNLPSPEKGVQLELPGAGASGWGKLGGAFQNLDGILLGEALPGGPALVRREVEDVLREAELSPSSEMTLQVDVRAVGRQGGGGLLVGTDARHYYAAVLRPVEQPGLARIWLLQLNGDQWEALAQQTLALDASRWHRISLVRKPDSLEILVDGSRGLRGKAELGQVKNLGVFIDPGSRLLVSNLLVAAP